MNVEDRRFRLALLIIGSWITGSFLGIALVTLLVIREVPGAAIAMVSGAVGSFVGGVGIQSGNIIKDYFDDDQDTPKDGATTTYTERIVPTDEAKSD